jgi:sulfoxide reductase catalytic subunit YedY
MPVTRIPPVPPSEITPREVWLNRRSLMAGMAGAIAGAAWPGASEAAPVIEPLVAPRNPGFVPKDAATDRKLATSYNNFYEFGTDKADPARYAPGMKVRPWTVEVTGEVAKPRVFGIEELLKFALEERVYRFRCVEAWSMVIPWVGFELNKLAAAVEPTSRAKYVIFTTALKREEMPGVRTPVPVIDWPYVEGLRIDEAMHPLTLLTLGMYGETLPNQNGAPVRLVVPWKYGFKSAKSLVRIEFVENRPTSSWTKAAAHEYGFFSNVNPNVDHPRWSQRRERLLPSIFASRETEMFNGYAEQVAPLYAGMDLKANF